MGDVGKTFDLFDSSGDGQSTNAAEGDICERSTELAESLKIPEKRTRSDSEEIVEDDDGFITVRKNNKRRATNLSKKSTENEANNADLEDIDKIMVSVTSKEILPKQFGLAKKLRAEKIDNIIKISYKNPFKVLIEFEDKTSAQKLVDCENFHALGFRCQWMNEISLCYGVVKNIDLDIEDKEFQESLECEVVSVRRLKRLIDTGEWVNSETVRLCFKGSTLPPYVGIYGYRFKVEPYTFPVTQCSACWRYGHLIKMCPTKKNLCPKCGEEHVNCETKEFKCLNCKGAHMALDKSCPIFLKEKEIRSIMCKENCTYRKALSLYINKARITREQYSNELTEPTQRITYTINNDANKKSFRDVLMTDAPNSNKQQDNSNCKQNMDNDEDQNRNHIESISSPILGKNKSKKKLHKDRNLQDETDLSDECFHINEEATSQPTYINEQRKSQQKTFVFKKIIEKVQNICLSENSFEVKIKSICSYVFEEIIQFVIKFVKSTDIMSKVFGLFTNG